VKISSCGSWLIIVFLLLAAVPVFAQEEEAEIEIEIETMYSLYPTFSYGTTTSWLTRIINQTGRSNFVLRDFLPGLYFCAEMRDMPYIIIPSVRLAAYYPLISTFNHVPQKPNTPLHFAVDFFAGARFETGWNFISVNVGPGLHMLFLSSDRWNYFNLGLAAVAGIELALNSKWSLLLDGFASIDNGNLGGNKQMEPFDTVWQYQLAIGVRYNKVKQNNPALFQPEVYPSRINR